MSKASHNRSISRFTDPGELSFMLDSLPDNIAEICQIAKQQTIHHNLLPYFNISRDKWKDMQRIWPPAMTDILTTLKDTAPHELSDNRLPEQRIIGACILESHFLTGLLRSKNYRARIRAGYFKDIRENSDHIVAFWEKVAREKRSNSKRLEENPEKWREEFNAYSAFMNEINHHIEHWVCEYWNADQEAWLILDANNTFLKAHSNIDVGFHLPEKHFEYAHHAWKKMRTTADFNPTQYEEEPQDGRSHIRSQLLWDFYSLLNHDLAGVTSQSDGSWAFVKERTFEDLTEQELAELDHLADLLSQQPDEATLLAFYNDNATLRITSAESDPFSYAFRTKGL